LIPRKVAAGRGAAVVGADDPPRAIHEGEDLERGTFAHRRHADKDRRATDRQRRDRKLARRAPPDGRAYETRHAVREVANGSSRFGRIVAGEEAVGRTDRTGDLE